MLILTSLFCKKPGWNTRKRNKELKQFVGPVFGEILGNLTRVDLGLIVTLILGWQLLRAPFVRTKNLAQVS